MNRQKPPRFCYSKALIVEGEDDFQFALSICKKLKIDDKIYIHSIGGKPNLAGEDAKEGYEGKSLLNSAKSTPFKENVKHLAILFDGDGNSEKTFKQIEKDLSFISSKTSELEFSLSKEKNKIENNLKAKSNKEFQILTFVYIFEKDLEDIFIQSLGEEDKRILNKCVLEFFKCAKQIEETEEILRKITDKNRVQALLSDKTEIRDIGSAARKNQINFQHTCFDDLKNFLLDFSKL